MTVKPYLDTRVKRKNDLYPIFICVRHGSKVKYIPLGIRIEKKYWNNAVIKSHPQHRVINSRISSLISDIQKYHADCLLHGRPFKIDLAGTGKKSYSFIEYLLHRAGQYDSKDQLIMGRKLRRLAKELTECFGELDFSDIDQDSIRKLESWQIKAGNVANTRAKKLANFRQFYQQAIDDKKAEAPNPFKQYKILSKPVNKEKLTINELKAIENLQLQPGAVANARNLFLFAYYCKGMRFENCITARRSDIQNGRINFRSNKGNKYISIKIHSRLKALIDLCDTNDFIFPYVKELPGSKHDYLKLIDSLNTVVNRNLKVVGIMAGIEKHLTFHISRHSFAYHLKQNTNNINIIQDSLGHTDQRTTQIYLKALGDEILDKEMDKLYGE